MAAPQQSTAPRLELRRTFAAPREKVFAAWTASEHLERWMCRDVPSHNVRYLELDARAGGRYRTEVQDGASGDLYIGQGVYRDVQPPEKLVFTWAWTKRQPDGGFAPLHRETLVTVEFFAKGDSCEVLLTHEFFETAKEREETYIGWNGCFDALAQFLGLSSPKEKS